MRDRLWDSEPTLPGVQRKPTPVPRKDRCVLTVLSGQDAGKVFHLTGGELVVGRSSAAHAALGDPRVSRRHARLVQRQDGIYLEDLGSKNGTLVGARHIEQPERIRDGQRVEVGDTVFKVALHDAQEERAVLSMYESSMRDPLTGIYNRRHFAERLDAELAFSDRHGQPIALLLIDVDHFKQINDRHGHPFADGVLKVVAVTIQRMLRTEDVLARYGGDEFVVLTRDMSHRNALILAQRIRNAVARLELHDASKAVRVTISVGVATSPDAATSEVELLAAADQALYRSKRGGRDQVHAETSAQQAHVEQHVAG